MAGGYLRLHSGSSGAELLDSRLLEKLQVAGIVSYTAASILDIRPTIRYNYNRAVNALFGVKGVGRNTKAKYRNLISARGFVFVVSEAGYRLTGNVDF